MYTELQWLTDYLFNRKQIVEDHGALSNAIPVYTVVPQGSIIGPLLFLIHFNDVNRTQKHTKVITYADDTVIFTSSSDTTSSKIMLTMMSAICRRGFVKMN